MLLIIVMPSPKKKENRHTGSRFGSLVYNYDFFFLKGDDFYNKYMKKDLALTFTISVRVKLVDHAAQLLISDVLTKLSGYSPKVPQADLSRFIIIKQLESF